MILTVVLSVLLSVLITLALTRYYFRKSSKNLLKLIKDLAPYEGVTTEKASAKLLLELIDALENNKIYWREFVVFVKAMIQAGHIANETIQHISLVESQRLGVATRTSPREAQSVRNIEILKLKQALEKQLKQ